MAQQLASKSTTSALDNAWHFICNALHQAPDNTTQTTTGQPRAFDTVIIGDRLGALTAETCLSTLQSMLAVFAIGVDQSCCQSMCEAYLLKESNHD